MAGLTFHYRWTWSLQADVESLWPYVSDTDRFREAVGFPPATFTEEPLSWGGTRRVGRIRMYGFPIVWEEEPFEWIRHRELTDTQNYRVGPLKYIKVHFLLEPRAGGGTDVNFDIWARPGNILGFPGIPVQIGLILRYRYARAFKRIDEYIKADAKQPFQARHSPLGTAGSARLREMASHLVQAGHGPALVDRLLDHVRNAPDHELSRMRPFVYAELWHTDRHATLEVFLRATKLGLLDLSWDMICPECRGAKHRHAHLDGVSHAGHCPSCNIDFEVDFARTVEATFQVNPAIKSVIREEFCLGSPQNTPHILLQQVIAPGESRIIKLLLEPRRYRWRAPRLSAMNAVLRTVNMPDNAINGRAVLDVNTRTKQTASTLTIRDTGLELAPAEIGAGVVSMTIANETRDPQVVLFEHTQWSDLASSAAEVTALQSFRDLFSSEALRPGESISVERLTILFTDLKGSTSMYQTVGDAPAFRQVMDHFGILRDGVIRNRGALVKTIGDAIMAVFSDPAHAVQGAFDIVKSIQEYNLDHPASPLVLKMGIHQGACIAVTLNERLDYFGTVVNLASRLEGQSQGNDVVISEAIATDPAIVELLNTGQFKMTSFTANLKGFANDYSLYRLTIAGSNDHAVAESSTIVTA